METVVFPRSGEAEALPDHTRVLIIGSGFSGLGMAIRLQQEGRQDFVVCERGDDVGGTWRDNSYPGAACDVPSRLYSFSFAPNARWSRSFSPQPEILDYLRECADRFGVRGHIRFGCGVERAQWDAAAQVWRVATTQGELTCDALVSGAGALSEPQYPDIPGLDRFTGTVFHSAAWDHSQDLTGKRVAVVGTGASAIQIVPRLVRRVAHLDLYQRTPAWIVPRNDRDFTRLERRLYARFPRLMRLARETIYWGRETQVLAFRYRPALMKVLEKVALRHLHRQVTDPDKRARLTPGYRIGCKRILISNDFYRSVDSERCDLVTSGIAEIRERAVVTRDGAERPCDAIVLATGFQVTPPPIADVIHDGDGRSLRDHWEKHGMRGHKGTTIPGFPNLFMLVGPNTGLGHTSMVYMIECQVQYVLDALRTMERERLVALAPRRDATERWNARIQRDLSGTVWQTGGCASWYLDQHGNNVTLWPDFTFRFRQVMARFDRSEYETVPAREPAVGAPA